MDFSTASERVCYVHCTFCNTILAVSVPCCSMYKSVTVRCGHCANLNIGLPPPPVVPHIQENFQLPRQHYNYQDMSKDSSITGGSSSSSSTIITDQQDDPQPRPPPIRPMSSSDNPPSREREGRKFLMKPPYKRFDMDVGYAHTTSLAEIFQIRVDKFDEIEGGGEVYGKIEVVDLERALTLYHQDRGNSEHVCANSTLTLTGPSQTITVTTGFCVSIDLRMHDIWGLSIFDEEDSAFYDEEDEEDFALGNWQLSWHFTEPDVARITSGRVFQDFWHEDNLLSLDINVIRQSADYDQPLCASFKGPNGDCITMYYAIFQHAVQAWVQVEVVDMEGVPNIAEYDVCGSITASYSHFERGNDSNAKDHCKTTLLKTKDLESMKVERWKKIQLSRCFIAVPVYASFEIEADLWSSSDLKIAKGKVEFTPNHFEVGHDYIRGDGDIAIRVMVCWSYGSRVPFNNPYVL